MNKIKKNGYYPFSLMVISLTMIAVASGLKPWTTPFLIIGVSAYAILTVGLLWLFSLIRHMYDRD